MRRAAALDLGSNSFHLLVADVRSRGMAGAPGPWIDRVATSKITLRLAERLAVDGSFGDAADRTVDAAGELVAEARAHGATELVCVATSAFREATDGPEVRARLRDEHGLDVRVLDGLAEGATSLLGMRAALQIAEGDPAVGLDLGGGSYEVVASVGGALTAGASLPLGAARLRFAHDPPWLAERAELFARARAELADVAGKVHAAAGHDASVVATAGTLRDIGRLALALATGTTPRKIRGLVVTREQIERAAARLCAVSVDERADLPGISRKRADLLPGGAIVLLATLEALGAPAVRLCHWGVREGALLDGLADGAVIGAGALRPLAPS